MSNAPFQSLLMVNEGAIGAACEPDLYWDNTVLLLHFDGVNNGIIFTDSSPKSKDIIFNGEIQTYSNVAKFGQSLDIPSSGGWVGTSVGLEDFQFGTGDFTVEFWMNTVSPRGAYIVDFVEIGIPGSWAIYIADNGTNVGFWNGTGIGTLVAATISDPRNQGWVHIAFARENNILRVYYNGVLENTVADATDYNLGTTQFTIGQKPGNLVSSNYFGYLDEFRITKGIARYIENSFNLPTIPNCNNAGNVLDCVLDPYYSCGYSNDPYWDNVVLMLHGNGINGGTTFTDSSLMAEPMYISAGSPITSTEQVKFGTSSIRIDTSGFIRTVATDSRFNLQGDFTIEMWVWRTPGSQALFYAFESGGTEFGGGNAYVFGVGTVGGAVRFNYGGATRLTLPDTYFISGAWNHIAVTRKFGLMRIFCNGRTDGNTYLSYGIFGVNYWKLGNSGNGNYGYWCDVRVTKGIARYSGNFNIPESAYPDVQENIVSHLPNRIDYKRIGVFLKFDGSNGETTAADLSPQVFPFSGPNGTGTFAITNTVAGPFGGGSFRFNWAGNKGSLVAEDFPGLYITDTLPRSALDITNGDFTIRFWVRLDSTDIITNRGGWIMSSGSWGRLFSTGLDSEEYLRGHHSIWMDTDGIIRFHWGEGFNNTVHETLSSGTVLALDIWHYIVIRRSGNIISIGINGVEVASTLQTIAMSNYFQGYYMIGGVWNQVTPAPLYSFQGYLAHYEVITYYSASYDVPANAFNWTEPRTVLSLHAENTTDASCFYPKTVTLFGDTVVSTDQFKFGTSSFYMPATNVATNIRIDGHMDFNVETSDFTIEFWAYYNDNSSGVVNLFDTVFGNNTANIVNGVLVASWYVIDVGTFSRTTTFKVSVSIWHHYIFQRRGTNLEIFIDGILTDLLIISFGNKLSYTSYLYFGGVAGGSNNHLNGYIDEIRLTNGVARYTSIKAFSLPDPYEANVILLLRGGLIDESSNNSLITITGTITQYKYYTQASSNSYFTVNTGVIGLLDGDFTLEIWFSSASFTVVHMYSNSGYIIGNKWNNIGGPGININSDTLGNTIGNWQKIEFTRSGNTIYSFVNGILVDSIIFTGAIDLQNMIFGYYVPNNNAFYDGYYGGIRLTRGIARHTATHDIPVGEWTHIEETLPNCDATPSSLSVISGTEHLSGVSVAIEQGNSDLSNRHIVLSGNRITAINGGIFTDDAASPSGTSQTYALTRTFSVSEANNYTITSRIILESTGILQILNFDSVFESYSQNWLTPIGAGASSDYEIKLDIISISNSSMFTLGLSQFGDSLWIPIDDNKTGTLIFNGTLSPAVSSISGSVVLMFSVRPRITSPLYIAGYIYQFTLTLNYVLINSGYVAYPELQNSSYTFIADSDALKFNPDGTIYDISNATIGRWIDSSSLLPGISSNFKLQVSSDPLPERYMRLNNSLISSFIGTNLSNINQFNIWGIGTARNRGADVYEGFTLRVIPTITNPRYNEIEYYSVHTILIFRELDVS